MSYIGHHGNMQALESTANSPKPQVNAVTAPPAPVVEALPRRFERFTLLTRVARGGMGEVYLATAQGIEGAERPLIIKTVRRDHASDRSFMARFLDEARIQAQLQHPGVAQILEANTDATGQPYVVVEYVEGRNLSDVRTRAGQLGVRISWPEALALSLCLAEALVHVHERTDADGRPLEIVHRDLSPQNVMVGYGGEVKLIDFGTARGQNRRCQTISGIVFAKPGYVAPEVANNAPGGVPADLYAFGVVLWELLAGRRFLTGEASVHLAAVGAGKRSLPPLSRVIGAPPEMDTLLGRLTATKIEDRYGTARAATQDLVKLLQRAPSLADGDRSVRGRIADLMRRLYPAEPAKSRAEFARRVAELNERSETRGVPPVLPAPASPAPPDSSDTDLMAGTRYRVIRELGRGAVGSVYEAVHLDLGRTVALKVLEADSMNAQSQSRFRAEARAIAQLDQQNLVKIFELGVCHDGRPFYSMELLAGESLDRRLARDKRLPVALAVDIGVQTCRALAAAHRAAVIHRDIKPANLFLTEAGVLKVLDFGVAKAAAEPAEVVAGESVVWIGTPEYMAPEQALGEATPESDVYALGVVLYELITGARPFAGSGPLAILEQKRKGGAELPSQRLGQKVPAALERALMQALDPVPERRQRSVSEFAVELELSIARPLVRRRLSRQLGGLAVTGTLAACLAVLGTAALRNPDVERAVSRVAQGASRLTQAVEQRRAQARAQVARLGVGMPSEAATEKSAVASLEPPLAAADAAPATLVAPPPASPSQAPPSALGVPAAQSALDEALADAEASAAADTILPSASTPAQDDAAERLLREASALTEQGRDLRALEVLRRAARKHGKDPAVLAAFAKALSRNRSWGEAVRVARQRLELDQSLEARLELARLERATGHRERALELLKLVVRSEGAPEESRELLRQWTGDQTLALRE
ncbi:MAG TPA: protein kinase [Polyangiaceae bacterium]|nr:protein kinase [Polyangiaceae bacterium]